ncbi:MAG: type II toxin-antitoxin system PemK/MazF family toxin [Campylobacterota bacterium]|nr:type II toxin-antitoxin system PemK/MazF family toxin [Campylobacterota bacterium]
MCIKKGEIYLANLGDKKELDIGKVRPVLVFQNNLLNRMLKDTTLKDVVVLPLSSQVRDNDFAYFLKARDKLKKDSVVLCNAIKMIDSSRLMREDKVLLTLSENEIIDIENILYNLIGCNNK